MDAIHKLSRHLDKVARHMLWVVIASMLITTAVQVASRYILNYSFFWAEELVRYMFVWASFLGGSVAFRAGGHLAFEVLIEQSSGSALGVILWSLRDAVVLISLSSLLYYGLTLTLINTSSSTVALGVSMSIPYLIIPLSSLMMIIHHASRIATRLQNR